PPCSTHFPYTTLFRSISNLDTQNFENFSDLLYSDKPDENKYKTSLSPRENINQIKNICFKFIENFEDKNQKNLLFTGNTGLGKTDRKSTRLNSSHVSI